MKNYKARLSCFPHQGLTPSDDTRLGSFAGATRKAAVTWRLYFLYVPEQRCAWPLTSRKSWKCGRVPSFLRRTVMKTTVATFGEAHFGEAALGHKRRNRCLVRIADRIYRHPGGTLPAKLHDPKDYKAMDRLMNRPEVTHAAVLETHRQRTLA